MCGIAGIWGTDRDVVERGVRAMNHAQAHRGPDDEGAVAIDVGGGTLGLGHRRLAILDLSSAGHQPMQHPETGNWIVFNGEIYNFQQLRADLEGRGHAFRTRTDTEVILAAFAEWGTACVERLYGMFAFALFSAHDKKLLLARDSVGIKPLYYGQGRDGSLALASEALALLATGLFEGAIDRQAIAWYLAHGSAPTPRTVFHAIRAVEPGCLMAFDLRQHGPSAPRVSTTVFWTFPHAGADDAPTQALHQTVRVRLVESVRSHLISDRPVGVFLSSGIDSSAIAAAAAEAKGGDVDFLTVRHGDNSQLDETRLAGATALKLGGRHHVVDIADREMVSLATKWFESLDMPTLDGLNTFIVSKAARDIGLTVVLSGLGGDELFGGYDMFRRLEWAAWSQRANARIPASIRWFISRSALPAMIDWRLAKATDLLALDDRSVVARCLWRRRVFSDSVLLSLGVEPSQLWDPSELLPEHIVRQLDSLRDDPFASVSIVESRFYMGNQLLRDSDVFSMRHSIELRVPFLGRPFIDFIYGLSGQARRGGTDRPKALLIDAMRSDLLPEVAGRRKTGFSLPYPSWIQGALRDVANVGMSAASREGLVDARGCRDLWARYLRNPRHQHWSHIWSLAALGHFATRVRGIVAKAAQGNSDRSSV